MARMLSGFCPSCNRTLYVDETSTPFCPVCSAPVLAAALVERDDTADGDRGDAADDVA
ncbi:MAG TPA: hypothetical protein VHJ34_12235 [Actinomycetota bacterium]|nr:hypothetical protein [Actinomycetota bacterium]